MGKVFPWKHVRDKHVPDHSSFPAVIAKMKSQFIACDAIFGAVVCGSAMPNAHTVRSDIDCVVAYSADEYVVVQAVLWQLNEYAATLHVPLELIPVDMQMGELGAHRIGRSFMAHLEVAAQCGGLIKRNPLDRFRDCIAPRDQDVRDYVYDKLHKLEKDVAAFTVMDQLQQCRVLQKAMEAPVHIARKLLWLRHIQLPDDSKATVTRIYPNCGLPSQDQATMFRRLTALDELYTKHLLMQLENPQPALYGLMLGNLKSAVPEVVGFVKSVARGLA